MPLLTSSFFHHISIDEMSCIPSRRLPVRRRRQMVPKRAAKVSFGARRLILVSFVGRVNNFFFLSFFFFLQGRRTEWQISLKSSFD